VKFGGRKPAIRSRTWGRNTEQEYIRIEKRDRRSEEFVGIRQQVSGVLQKACGSIIIKQEGGCNPDQIGERAKGGPLGAERVVHDRAAACR